MVPLVLSAAFSAVSVALRAYKLVEARSDLSSAGMLAMETLGQDLRGMCEVYDDSSGTHLRGRLQDNTTDVAYDFTPPSGSLSGTVLRNGKDLFGSDTSVTSCEFVYLAPGPDPDDPLQEDPSCEVSPQNASSVRVRLVIARGSTSMTFESVFDLRNL